MAVLVMAAARLAFHRGGLPRPSGHDLRALAVLLGALSAMTALQAFDLFAVEAERLFVAGLAAAGAFVALSRGPWPGEGTGVALAGLVLPVAAWAVVVSRTRNAWLGALVGLALIAVLRAPRLLWGLAAVVAAVVVLRPAPVVGRLTVVDASSVDRYYMWQAGIDMIRDKPVFGQGPGRILAVYPEYRWPAAPNAQQPHLHDNALQIAAERGLPCLAWWLWWVAAAMGDAWREVRRGAGWAAVAALALLAAFMAAGLFEYNFGDSEILMFTLLVSALPYALRRERARAPA
jgi:O-antigen ligase